MANPIEQVSWTVQTRIRELSEGITWRLIQWFEQSPKPDANQNMDWGWLIAGLEWSLRGLGLVLLGLGIYLLGRFLWRSRGRWQRRQRRMVSLESPRSHSDWLAIAQAAQAEQDYRKAFQALYWALLGLLNDANLLRHDAARTDREAIQRLNQLWSLSDQPIAVGDDWVLLFETHEALCFGGKDVSRDRFLQCRVAYDQLVPFLQRQATF